MKITCKRQFFELWEAGALGNRTEIWRTLEEALTSRSPKVGFREIRRAGSTGAGAWVLLSQVTDGFDQGRVTFEARVRSEFMTWKSFGRDFIMDNAVPNHKSTMQGEICRTFLGLQSFLAIGYGLPPMRLSMAQGLHKHRNGAETHLLLERYMDASSRDDLRELMDLYPDAAVEFTCFDVKVGNLPHRNTIFWEVRDY